MEKIFLSLSISASSSQWVCIWLPYPSGWGGTESRTAADPLSISQYAFQWYPSFAEEGTLLLL